MHLWLWELGVGARKRTGSRASAISALGVSGSRVWCLGCFRVMNIGVGERLWLWMLGDAVITVLALAMTGSAVAFVPGLGEGIQGGGG